MKEPLEALLRLTDRLLNQARKIFCINQPAINYHALFLEKRFTSNDCNQLTKGQLGVQKFRVELQ